MSYLPTSDSAGVRALGSIGLIIMMLVVPEDMSSGVGACNIMAGYPEAIPFSITFSFVSAHPYPLVIHIQHSSARIRALSSVSDASRWIEFQQNTRECGLVFFLLASYAIVPCFMYAGNAASRYFPSTKLHPVSFTLNPRDPH